MKVQNLSLFFLTSSYKKILEKREKLKKQLKKSKINGNNGKLMEIMKINGNNRNLMETTEIS